MKKVIITAIVGGMLAFVACSQVAELQKPDKAVVGQAKPVR